MLDLFYFLSEHTQFLLAGLWTNVYISLASMIVGTLLGTMVAIPIARN